MKRVLPAVALLKKRFDIPISVDTYRSGTAYAALDEGADLINDVWGLRHPEDPTHELAKLISNRKCPVIIMHNNSVTLPDEDMGKKAKDSSYPSLYMENVIGDLKKSIEIARLSGINDDKIIIDPGIGFAKSVPGNIHCMNHAEVFTSLGYPLLLGISRKSLIGKTLGLPTEEREEATVSLNVIGRMKGYHIFRVHDVKSNRRALDMCDVILNDKGLNG